MVTEILGFRYLLLWGVEGLLLFIYPSLAHWSSEPFLSACSVPCAADRGGTSLPPFSWFLLSAKQEGVGVTE